jgi:hypothetical protein
MKTRTMFGIILGAIYGAAIIWGAVILALPAGGFVALAAALDGLMGAIGGGGLVAAMVALCPVEEEYAREVAEPKEADRVAA